METAVGYARVSDPRQLKGTSLEVQLGLIRRHAEARGYDLAKVFVEDGRSAKTTRRRVLAELHEYVKSHRGRVHVVIFPKIDRLARNAEDFLSLQRRLRGYGVRLDSVGEHIEDTPVGRFNTLVQAGVAQLDNEIRAERSYAGMVEAVRQGRWVWQPPYGYRSVRRKGEKKKGNGTIEPDPAAAPVVGEFFARVAEGKLTRLDEMAAWLSERGAPTSRSTVHRMIRNKAYIGVIEAFGDAHEAKPPFLPLVSRSTFHAANERCRSRKQLPKRHERDNPDFPLRGTLRCACGDFLTANWVKGRSARYAYYRCMRCERTNHRREEVEDAFLALLGEFRPRPERMGEIANAVRAAVQARVEAARLRRDEIAEALAGIAELRRALSVKVAMGVVPDDVAREQFAVWDEERGGLEAESEGLARPGAEIESALAFAASFLSDLGGYWLRASLANKKKLQGFLYSTGLEYTKSGSFRTADSKLQERAKGVVRTSDFRLVDRAAQDPNHELWKFFFELRSNFEEEYLQKSKSEEGT